MAEELFWKVYESLERWHPEFLTSSWNYPGLPYRFRRRTLRAVDSTTISLTAYNMAWAKHRRQKAAAKMHTALNMRSFLPNFVILKGARDSDPKTAWELCSQMRDGEIVVFDKAYVDFRPLQALKERGVSWVTRSKDNMLYEVVGRHVEGKWVAPGSLQSSPAVASCDVVGQQATETERSHGGAMAPSAKGRRQRVASADVVGQKATEKRKYSWKKCKILSDEKVKLTGVKTNETLSRRAASGQGQCGNQGEDVRDGFHQRQSGVVLPFHLPALPMPLGRGGLLQGNQANASTGGLPRL